jgi:hypothetical protein
MSRAKKSLFMLQHVKKLIQKLPSAYANIMKLDCLTGLRPAEAVEAVRLINDKEKLQTYYKPERIALENFVIGRCFVG